MEKRASGELFAGFQLCLSAAGTTLREGRAHCQSSLLRI